MRQRSGMDIVNLEEYPVDADWDSKYYPLLKSSIDQLGRQGFVSLPNFLRPDAVEKLAASILELEQTGAGFQSSDSHNVFLEEDDGDTPSASLQQSSSPASMHPRHIRLESSKRILNARDLAPHAAGLDRLFLDHDFIVFLSSILQTPLHPSADPCGKYYANVYREGDGLNWHFDRSEYSVSLILRPADEGGKFQFVPNAREVVEGWDAMPLEVEDVARALQPHAKKVEEPTLAAADMYIFRGRDSLHRVSNIAKGTRINVILTYNAEPGVRLNRYTLRKFFGVEDTSEDSTEKDS